MAIGGSDVMDSANVRMIQRRRGSSFSIEAFEHAGVRGPSPDKHFDGYCAMQARIPSAVDFAHATRPKFIFDTVRADLDPSAQRNRCRTVQQRNGGVIK